MNLSRPRPSRPTVAGPTWPTSPLSDLLDKNFKPFPLHVKGYVRENIDFFERCSRVYSENTILASVDVITLYINFPHAYGLQALSYWINKHPGSLYEWFNKQLISESTRLILENNNCKFNLEFFVQTNGTAVGTIFAPTYATICINEFDEKIGQFILENLCRFISKVNPNNPTVYNPIKNFVEVLKRNNVPGFESIKIINSKRQQPNLKKLLSKAEFKR